MYKTPYDPTKLYKYVPYVFAWVCAFTLDDCICMYAGSLAATLPARWQSWSAGWCSDGCGRPRYTRRWRWSGRHERRHGLIGVCLQGWRWRVGGGAATHWPAGQFGGASVSVWLAEKERMREQDMSGKLSDDLSGQVAGLSGGRGKTVRRRREVARLAGCSDRTVGRRRRWSVVAGEID
jgi:hypothetical protein